LTDGILLLDKPAGQTSFQSLGAVKRRLGTRRVGHAGTLDKFAEGLLVVLAGRMTRLCAFAASLDKEYVAVATFGKGTETLDPEGRVTAEGPVPDLADLEAALPAFRGALQQRPPAYSAVHVGGQRAYEVARSGGEPVLVPRAVVIHSLQLVEYRPPNATLRICCSKGTYIRSLARDIAVSLGTCAYLSALRRTRIGGFRLEDARTAEQFDPATDLLSPGRFFDAVPGLGRLSVKAPWEGKVGNGFPLDDAFFEHAPSRHGTFGAFSSDGRLLAVVERGDSGWRYAAAFPEEQPAGSRQPPPGEPGP
jgi:tRNA pseudouridine55 synthase